MPPPAPGGGGLGMEPPGQVVHGRPPGPAPAAGRRGPAGPPGTPHGPRRSPAGARQPRPVPGPGEQPAGQARGRASARPRRPGGRRRGAGGRLASRVRPRRVGPVRPTSELRRQAGGRRQPPRRPRRRCRCPRAPAAAAARRPSRTRRVARRGVGAGHRVRGPASRYRAASPSAQAVPGEAGGPADGPRHERSAHAGRQSSTLARAPARASGSPGAHQEGGVAQDLGQGPGRRGHHRHAGRHGLERREPEALVERRVGEDGAPARSRRGQTGGRRPSPVRTHPVGERRRGRSAARSASSPHPGGPASTSATSRSVAGQPASNARTRPGQVLAGLGRADGQHVAASAPGRRSAGPGVGPGRAPGSGGTPSARPAPARGRPRRRRPPRRPRRPRGCARRPRGPGPGGSGSGKARVDGSHSSGKRTVVRSCTVTTAAARPGRAGRRSWSRGPRRPARGTTRPAGGRSRRQARCSGRAGMARRPPPPRRAGAGAIPRRRRQLTAKAETARPGRPARPPGRRRRTRRPRWAGRAGGWRRGPPAWVAAAPSAQGTAPLRQLGQHRVGQGRPGGGRPRAEGPVGLDGAGDRRPPGRPTGSRRTGRSGRRWTGCWPPRSSGGAWRLGSRSPGPSRRGPGGPNPGSTPARPGKATAVAWRSVRGWTTRRGQQLAGQLRPGRAGCR